MAHEGFGSSRACSACVLSLVLPRKEGVMGSGLPLRPCRQKLALRSYLDRLHVNAFEQDRCPRLLCVCEGLIHIHC